MWRENICQSLSSKYSCRLQEEQESDWSKAKKWNRNQMFKCYFNNGHSLNNSSFTRKISMEYQI